MQEQAQRRKVAARLELEAVPERMQRVGRFDGVIDGGFVEAEGNERPQLEPMYVALAETTKALL